MKVEDEISLQTDMNSISNDWDSTKWAEFISIVFPQVRTTIREKGEWEKKTWKWINQRKTLIYIHMYIHTHTYGHINLYRDTHIFI